MFSHNKIKSHERVNLMSDSETKLYTYTVLPKTSKNNKHNNNTKMLNFNL